MKGCYYFKILLMRNKSRFQYVDEFRKISCIEKLTPIDNLHPDDEEDAKQENNKFIRYKQQVMMEGINHRGQDYLFNDIITGYKIDIQNDCSEVFTVKNTNISNDINYFQNWSGNLNKEIKDRDYKHKFYFKEATPPPRLKKEQQMAKDKTSLGRNANEEIMNEKNENHNNDTTNLELPQKGKYNFHQITKHLYANNRQNQDKDNTFLRDLTIKNQIAELRKLKNLQQIQKIGEFNQEFNKFAYYIQPQEDRAEIEYVDNSIVRGNNPLTIDYFRDIGTPSRQILEYTINKEKKMNIEEQKGVDLESDYRQESRELLYLYFLREEELKINKSQMTFYDIANMSMGRVTSNNAHMCVRNQKVTKAQYAKLLKKMQKYDLRENESNKHKQDKLIGTQQIEQMAMNNSKGQQQIQDKQDTANIENIIDEINKIRKEVKLFEEKNTVSKINKANFNNQIYKKLESLLNLLYDLVTEKMSIKYPIHQIGYHLSEMSGTNQLGYDRLRILWYIANCYDQMMTKQKKTIDLRNLGSMQPKEQPGIIKYKQKKVIGEDTIQTKKVYGFNLKPEKDKAKDKTPTKYNPKTPTKFNRTPTKGNKTPTKSYGNTGSKLNTSQNTARKHPFTAKK